MGICGKYLWWILLKEYALLGTSIKSLRHFSDLWKCVDKYIYTYVVITIYLCWPITDQSTGLWLVNTDYPLSWLVQLSAAEHQATRWLNCTLRFWERPLQWTAFNCSGGIKPGLPVSRNSSIIIQYDNCYSRSVRYFDIQAVVRTTIQQQWSGMVWVGCGRTINLNQF